MNSFLLLCVFLVKWYFSTKHYDHIGVLNNKTGFYLYDIHSGKVENLETGNWSVDAKFGEGKGVIVERHKQTFWADGNVLYLMCGSG